MVNGERQNFAEYVAKKAIDTRLPLWGPLRFG